MTQLFCFANEKTKKIKKFSVFLVKQRKSGTLSERKSWIKKFLRVIMSFFSEKESSILSGRAKSVFPDLEKYNFCMPDNGKIPVLLAGAEYKGLWIEHNQDALFIAERFPETAWETVRLPMDFQLVNGLLPHAVRFDPLKINFGQLQTVFPVVRCALEVAKKTCRSEEDLLKIYRCGKAYDDFLEKERNRSGSGLVEMYCSFDTGHDNSRRVMDGGLTGKCPGEYAGNMPDLPCMPILAADLSATRYGGLIALVELAEMLGKDREAKIFAEKAEALREKIYELLYCIEDEFFYDRSQNEWRKYRTEHITRMFLNQVVSQEHFDRIFERYFTSDKEFFTPFPFPSVSVSDPSFNKDLPHNCWGCNTQALTLLRSVLWMEHYGRTAELEEVMRRFLRAYLEHENPYTQELDPFTGEPNGSNANYTPAMLFFYLSCEKLKII